MLFLLLLAATVSTPAATFDAASATNAVGLDLYRRLAAGQPSGNLVLSPYSIESALAMTYLGADGGTRTELARVLRLPPDDAAVEDGLANLRAGLDRAVDDSKRLAEQRRRFGGQSDVIEWRAANRLFGQQGYAFRDEFLERMKAGFAAPFEALDFKTAAEKARTTINGWVEDQTKQRIRDLIPRGGLTADSRLVLVNALYLKAPWSDPFSVNDTQPEPFHLTDGAAPTVPTMRNVGYYGYAVEDRLTVVSLAYVGGGLHFLILLPRAGDTVDALAARVTPTQLARWAHLGSKGPGARLNLHLPKFRLTSPSLPLGRALRALGAKTAFDEPQGAANFDRIAPRKPNDYLAISEVFHQTFIALDEEGTEAAAATAVLMAAAGAAPAQPIEVRIDRPFLFAIQDRDTGACLFLGRISDPR